MTQVRMDQPRKPRKCGNYQQYLKPSELFKETLLHNRKVTSDQVKNGKVVAKYTQGGWSNDYYWLDYVLVNGEVFLNDKLPNFIAASLDEFKEMVQAGKLKFVKMLEG